MSIKDLGSFYESSGWVLLTNEGRPLLSTFFFLLFFTLSIQPSSARVDDLERVQEF